MKTLVTKVVLLGSMVLFSGIAGAANLVVNPATITRLQAIEGDGSGLAVTNSTVWAGAIVYVNGNDRVGPHPITTSTQCQLSTQDKTVYATLLAAMLSGTPGQLSYTPRSGKDANFCSVQWFMLTP